MHNELHAGIDVAKMVPGATYIGLTMGGVSLADWVAILTGIYMVAQIVLLFPKYKAWYLEWRSKRD